MFRLINTHHNLVTASVSKRTAYPSEVHFSVCFIRMYNTCVLITAVATEIARVENLEIGSKQMSASPVTRAPELLPL